ncbi:MAG: metallophosphoesterase [Bacteroidales bacterium]|nr:metallophosphoesterase [Bacteroidales bacterium]
MSKKAFIHLSDLHVAAKQRVGGVDNSERANKTWLVAQTDEDNHDYIKVFCEYVKKKYKDYDMSLLISGDISDMSEKNEYDCAETFLKQIMYELNIPKERLLLVPGNHDINRKECQQEAESDNSKQAHLCNHGKYKFFAEFYQNITGKDYPYDDPIVDLMPVDDEKLLFVGVNSNFKIGYVDGYGAVDTKGFKTQMTDFNRNYNDYIKIALFHHNIVSDYDNNSSSYGSFKKDDWLNFKQELEYSCFKCVMFGNEHTRASHNVGDNTMYYSDAGSFALKVPHPSFKIYLLEQDESRMWLRQVLIELNNVNKKGDRIFGAWVEQNINDVSEQEIFVLKEQPSSPMVYSDSLPDTNVKLSSELDQQEKQGLNRLQYKPHEIFREELLEIIRKENLFHQGHFHWGKNSRSLNWIDTISLLSDRSHTKLIQRELLDVIKNNNIDCRCVIGVGIEGNILSSALLGKAESYTYLPYSYRYDEANKCERNMCVSNEDKSIKQVLVITDVVHKGRTLRTLFEERESVFFKNINVINVVSLFYTGSEKRSNLPEGLADMGDRVRFLSLVDLEVGKCPYGDNYKLVCSNYNHRLCEVYKFYNE